MKITRELTSSLMISGISERSIRIGEKTYTRTVVLTSSKLFDAWEDKPVAKLTPADFDTLLATGPELIVLGTGKNNIFAPRELVFALARQGIGFEVMDTAAAARTFNVLASENRRVAAVLYI